ncbi:MAG: hypothetical protein LAO51_19990 [Acidobacteriia bacterium]|nr:hypothetical protein [Terriglobia bacterium]
MLAYLAERCSAGDGADRMEAYGGAFDRISGHYLIRAYSYAAAAPPPPYESVRRIMHFAGFATLFDVLQTYTPAPATIGFRVPYMPEGMPAADHFDTYWGDLSTVGTWSQAYGLQCHYPAAPPARGDYVTVADTLPTPQPGHGYYFVTSATYQGQTRYGKKTSGGKLSGRDPAVLPNCR